MKRIAIILGAVILVSVAGFVMWRSLGRPRAFLLEDRAAPAGYVGSASCRECHEAFHKKWSTSWHGLAMQPYRAQLAAQLKPLSNALAISNAQYRVEIGARRGTVIERGPGGERRYPIRYAAGGKNVYFFLTELDRGRLQVLPVAYDVRRQEWYDMARGAMRHFREAGDQPFHWRDRVFTFNTACYQCHVSQVDQNYDPRTDTYRTRWTEPGINCETCHGPSLAHVELFKKLPAGSPVPADIKILVTKKFTHEQRNSSCAPCHAKMTPITAMYPPGERFLDHFDLVTLEDRDWYPDGRDLGENFTETTWRINACVSGGQLDCIHCHTSSGRYRFSGDRTNQACAPCHQARVNRVAAHSHHAPGSVGSQCVSCHMPMTEFARMRRSDHSLRPPNPAATVAFGSPNACNLCHAEKTAEWAADWVAKWHPDPSRRRKELARARLVDAARKREWKQLPAMLDFIKRDSESEVFVAGLIRLLAACPDERTWPAYRIALRSPSALVRARAAEALNGLRDPETISVLARACGDDVRLVRIRAAQSLAGCGMGDVPDGDRPAVDRAARELVAALVARPDDVASHYNLGNFYLAKGDPSQAARAFEAALRLHPDNLMALANSSLAYNALGNNPRAEANLRRAQSLEPTNSVVNLNLGLLLGELGKTGEAVEALKVAWRRDPNNAVAAYNLGVLLSRENPAESTEWCRRAMVAAPREPKYAYTLAFYERKQGRDGEAIRILGELMRRSPGFPDAVRLLGQIYEEKGDAPAARALYQQAAKNPAFPPPLREQFGKRATAAGARER